MSKLLYNKLFLAGLAVKLIFSVLFFSQIENTLFVPFIDYFSSTHSSPYEYFAGTNKFPYPAMMLYMLTFFQKVFFFLPSEIAVKFTLLIADTTILIILLSWLKKNTKQVLALYWLSPVLIYVNYIHGQLDVIPIALLFISLYFLFKERLNYSMILLGFALAAKTSIVLVVPFFYVYIFYQIISIRKLLLLSFLPILTFCFLNLPFILDASFQYMVFFNEVQNAVFQLTIPFSDINIVYIVIVGYIILFFQAVLIKIRTRELFLIFMGFAFGIIILFVIPMPGWYYWILPLWIYFYATSSPRETVLFYLLQTMILVYFAYIPTSDYLISLRKILPSLERYNLYLLSGNSVFIYNMIFSVLQSIFLLNIYWLWQRGIYSFSRYKLFAKPMLLGIGGNSGTGKTTIARAITQLFGDNNATNIKGDDMHKWERGNSNWSNYTHLDPRANDLYDEQHYLYGLKHNFKILRKHYDHDTGRFIVSNDPIKSKKIIIYDGLHPFYLKKTRELFDLKIFIKPDEELSIHWKIVRDIEKRGYCKEKVLSQIADREHDYLKYIATQEQNADIVIYFKLHQPIQNIGIKDATTDVYLVIKCSNSTYLEPFVEICYENGINIIHEYGENDAQLLIFNNIEGIELSTITQASIKLDLFLLGINSPAWFEGMQGLIQLFLAYYILEMTNDK